METSDVRRPAVALDRIDLGTGPAGQLRIGLRWHSLDRDRRARGIVILASVIASLILYFAGPQVSNVFSNLVISPSNP
jgi:hypothetical protein